MRAQRESAPEAGVPGLRMASYVSRETPSAVPTKIPQVRVPGPPHRHPTDTAAFRGTLRHSGLSFSGHTGSVTADQPASPAKTPGRAGMPWRRNHPFRPRSPQPARAGARRPAGRPANPLCPTSHQIAAIAATRSRATTMPSWSLQSRVLPAGHVEASATLILPAQRVLRVDAPHRIPYLRGGLSTKAYQTGAVHLLGGRPVITVSPVERGDDDRGP